MASPSVFANRIRRLVDNVPENANSIKRRAALAIDQALVLATPVDTGRARANWRVGLDRPVSSEVSQPDPVGQETINRNASDISRAQEGQEIYISNNVPYIGVLNAGSSSQAPAMFVERAVQLGVNLVRGARLLGRRGG